MKRIGYKLAVGLFTAVIGLALIGTATAADTTHKTASARGKSPAANAPLIARMVVKPSPGQMAKIRAERRAAELEKRAVVAQKAGSGQSAATGEL